jgi:hypothetical protein
MGVTLAYMLDGRLPWPVDTDLRKAIISGAWRIDRQLPADVHDLVTHMLIQRRSI